MTPDPGLGTGTGTTTDATTGTGTGTSTGATRPGWRARLDVALWRHGLAWPAAGLLLLSALVLELWQVRGLQARLDDTLAQTQAQTQTQNEAQAAAASQARADTLAGTGAARSPRTGGLASPANLAALGSALGPADADAAAALGRLSALARRHGIDLSQGQYQTSSDPQGGLQRLQITLPAQAGYGQARAFVQDLLLALPQASLDQLELKRNGRTDAQLAMLLKLSLWHLAQPLPDAAGRRPEARP